MVLFSNARNFSDDFNIVQLDVRLIKIQERLHFRWRSRQKLSIFPLCNLGQVVEACSFYPIFGGFLQLSIHRMGGHSQQLFAVDENFLLPPVFQRL